MVHFVKSQIQFSSNKFIEETISDTTFYLHDITPIDSNILKFNLSYLYTYEYSYSPTIEKDWFVDNATLVICPINSLCFENECGVYTWKIENEKLFLQSDRKTCVLTHEDLFEKIKNHPY
jgi:hypothetical protein